MRSNRLGALVAILICLDWAWAVSADPPGLATLSIGAKAPDFRLPGVDGELHRLGDYAKARVLVVVFTCNHCPTAQAYETRIERLASDYKGKGVEVVAISPNDPLAVRLDELGYTDLGDSFEEMKIRARDHHFTFPYLYDGENQAVSRAYGVLATPQVYVFDESRTLRYVGRFDDADSEPKVKSRDTINAVEAVLAGKEVTVAKTRVFGCSTKWSDKRADAAKSLSKWDAEPVSLDPIDLEATRKLAKNDSGRWTLVSLWATWCGPCVAELPELVEMNRMYRGRPFRMVTVSLDEPAKKADALRILRENHVSTANYLMTAESRDAFADALDKEWPGPVPYTLLIAPGGEVVYRKSGAIDPLELKRAIVARLGRTH